MVQQGRGFFTVRTTCPRCRGRGRVIVEPCKRCRGAGKEAVRRRIEKLLAEADRNLRLANERVDLLKKKWLIPTHLLPPAPVEPAPASRWRLFGR